MCEKHLSAVHHADVSQCVREAPGPGFVPPWHGTTSGGQLRAEAQPEPPSEPPSELLFPKRTWETFHSQLSAWVLPFQLAKKEVSGQVGILSGFYRHIPLRIFFFFNDPYSKGLIVWVVSFPIFKNRFKTILWPKYVIRANIAFSDTFLLLYFMLYIGCAVWRWSAHWLGCI